MVALHEVIKSRRGRLNLALALVGALVLGEHRLRSSRCVNRSGGSWTTCGVPSDHLPAEVRIVKGEEARPAEAQARQSNYVLKGGLGQQGCGPTLATMLPTLGA